MNGNVDGPEIARNFKVVSRTRAQLGESTEWMDDERPKRADEDDTLGEAGGPRLPSDRAFVVQFRCSPGLLPAEPPGRVEHLVSGAATEFETWPELRRFVERVLSEAEAVDPRGMRDRRAAGRRSHAVDREAGVRGGEPSFCFTTNDRRRLS
jgi:hypothetical protein